MRRFASFALAFLVSALAVGAEGKTFVYVYDGSDGTANDPKLYGYAFDARSGSFDPVPGSPFEVPDGGIGCTTQCQAIDYAKKRKTLVVSGATGLSSFLVEKDGSLAAVAGSPFAGGPLLGVATVQVGKRSFAYAANDATGGLHGYEIGSDGALVALAGSPFDSGMNSPLGAIARKRFLFVADEPVDGPTLPALGVFVVGDDGTPAAAPGSPLELPGTYAFNVGADAAGRYAYVADDAEPPDQPIAVHVVAIDKKTGAPSLVPGSPFDTALVHQFADGASAGKGIVAVLAPNALNDLALFRTAKGGALEPLGGVKDTTVNVRTHAFGGKFLFAASPLNVIAIAIRKKDGAIDHSATGAVSAGEANPVGIVVINR